jgi:hypothetical protein
VNKVFRAGRPDALTRDPDMPSLASGKNVTTFSDAVTRAGRTLHARKSRPMKEAVPLR